jgi:hypothetical protein
MNWRECFLADQPMMMKLQDAMPEMLMRHVQELYLYMLELDPALTQSLNLILPQKCIMSIFTCIAPIEISK